MAAAETQLPPVALFLGIPADELSAGLVDPSTKVLEQVLQAVLVRVSEYESLKAQKLKADVDLESAIHSQQNQSNSLKASADRTSLEIARLREQVQTEEQSRQQLQADLRAARNETTALSEQIEALQTQRDSLERSHQHALSLAESRAASYDEIKSDLVVQRERNHEQRIQISSLEQKIRDLEGSAIRSKFSHTRALQEVTQLQSLCDQLNEEISTKSAEATKSRKEHNSQLSQARQKISELESSVSFLQNTETTLRRKIGELNQKIEDGIEQTRRTQEQVARDKEHARNELRSTSRLAELHESAHQNAKARIEQLESTIHQMREHESEELVAHKQAFEFERTEKEAAESKAVELEQHIRSLENRGSETPVVPASPASFKPSVNGYTTPSKRGIFSGLFTPSSSRIKSGNMSMTQLYAEHSAMLSELEKEKNKSFKLKETVDRLMTDLEAREPEVSELQHEHERLETRVSQLTAALDVVRGEREQARKEALHWQSEVTGAQRRAIIFEKQVRDFNHQVLVLAGELHARDQGDRPLAPAEQLLLERLARDEAERGVINDMTGLDQVIRQRLTGYRSIRELQEQNSSLRLLARELEMKANGSEMSSRLEEAERDREQLQALQSRLSRYQQETQALMTNAKAFARERDMFRGMLQQRGQSVPEPNRPEFFAKSVAGDTAPRTPSRSSMMSISDQASNSRDARDHSVLLKELQKQYDSYKVDAANDRKSWREQIDKINGDKNELQLRLASSENNLKLASERYEILQSSVDLFKSENNELRKRMQALSETNYKHEFHTQQAAEDLIEAKAMLDSLRSELSTAKAEKTFFKSIEARLEQENDNLQNERSKLNQLVVNLQTMQSEREVAEGDSRRRLEIQIEQQHREMNELRRKMDIEIGDARKATQRRELEREQLTNRSDELMRLLSSAKAETVAAQATERELNAKIDQMSTQLQAAEQGAVSGQRFTSPRKTALQDAHMTNGISADDPAQDQSWLITDLRHQLEASQREASSAREDIEQYKAMSLEMETAMEHLNETQAAFQTENEQTLYQKDAQIKELTGSLGAINAELSDAQALLSSAQDSSDNDIRRIQAEREALEQELKTLREDVDRLTTTANYLRQDLRAQAEIAQDAQNNYEQAMVDQGEATDALAEVRSELNAVKLEALEFKTEANSSREALQLRVDQWDTREESHNSEIEGYKQRLQNVTTQCAELSSHLENLGGQLEALRDERRQSIGLSSQVVSEAETSSVDSLQEVIRYLRNEKEIVDTRHELATQEATRLRQQVKLLQSQADELRVKLEEEKSLAASGGPSILHQDLMGKINELNLYRESNMKLRIEVKESQEHLAEATARVAELETSVQPLHERIKELELEQEVERSELKLVSDDRDHWRERAQAVMQRNDQADPDELVMLKTRVGELETERDGARQENQTLADQNAGLRERQNKLVTDTKARLKTVRDEAQEKAEQLAVVNGQLETAQAELAHAQVAATEAEQRLAEQQGELQVLKTQVSTQLEDAAAQQNAAGESVQQALDVASGELESLRTQLEQAQQELLSANTQVGEMQQRSAAHQERISHLESELERRMEEPEAAHTHEDRKIQSSGEIIVKLEEQVSQLQTELSASRDLVEELQAKAATAVSGGVAQETSPAVVSRPDTHPDLAETKQELERQYQELQQALEIRLQTRTDKMQKSLTEKLKTGKDEMRAQYEATSQEALDKLRGEHVSVLAELKRAHEQELESLRTTAQAGAAVAQSPATRAPNGIGDGSALSDTVIRTIFKNNQTAQNILRTNIVKSKEALEKTLKDDFDTKLGEEKRKHDQMLQQTSRMGDSRQEIIRRNLNNIKAQMQAVQTAAQDTPQKPVVEVWDVAKTIKAPPATPTASTSAMTPSAGPSVRPITPVDAANFTASLQQTQSPVFAQPLPSQLPVFGAFPQPQAQPQPPEGVQIAGRAASGIPTANRGGRSIPRGAGAQRARGGLQSQLNQNNENVTHRQSQLPRGGAAGGNIPRSRQSSGAIGNNRQSLNLNATNGKLRPPSRQGGANALNASAPQFTPANSTGSGGAGQKRGRDSEVENGNAKRQRSEGQLE